MKYFKTITLLLFCFHVSAFSIKSPIISNFDSISIDNYIVESNSRFVSILNEIIDSCETIIGCNKLEFIYLEVDILDSQKIITFNDMKGFRYLRNSSIGLRRFASFKFNGTCFLFDVKDLEYISSVLFEDKLVFSRTKQIESFSEIDYECLKYSIDGIYYDVLFYFIYKFWSSEFKMIDYMFFVDSGNSGF